MIKGIKSTDQDIKPFQQWYFLVNKLKGQFKSMSRTVYCSKPRWIFLEHCNHTIFLTQHDTSTISPHSYGFLWEFLPFQFQPTFNTLLHCWYNIHCLTSWHLCRMYEHYLWVSISTCANINNFIFHYWTSLEPSTRIAVNLEALVLWIQLSLSTCVIALVNSWATLSFV